MGRKKVRIPTEEKLRIVEQICNGNISISEGARCLKLDVAKVSFLTRLYREQGAAALLNDGKNNSYSDELKRQAVISYLRGDASLRDIAAKFGIRSIESLRDWIMMYNNGKEFSHKMSGESRMIASRQTTKEERIKVATECIANGLNYGETAIKYNVGYHQVYGWVKRYKEFGEAGLEDRRGRRKLNQEPRSELEKLQIENERLRHQLYMTEMERDLLKKLDELERKDLFRK